MTTSVLLTPTVVQSAVVDLVTEAVASPADQWLQGEEEGTHQPQSTDEDQTGAFTSRGIYFYCTRVLIAQCSITVHLKDTN